MNCVEIIFHLLLIKEIKLKDDDLYSIYLDNFVINIYEILNLSLIP